MADDAVRLSAVASTPRVCISAASRERAAGKSVYSAVAVAGSGMIDGLLRFVICDSAQAADLGVVHLRARSESPPPLALCHARQGYPVPAPSSKHPLDSAKQMPFTLTFT